MRCVLPRLFCLLTAGLVAGAALASDPPSVTERVRARDLGVAPGIFAPGLPGPGLSTVAVTGGLLSGLFGKACRDRARSYSQSD